MAFSRRVRTDEHLTWRQWDTRSVPDLSGLDALINLAGEAIDQRWTQERKKKFRRSRVDLSRHLAEAVDRDGVPVWLNASAVGFYGDRGDELLTESSAPGSGYLSELTQEWEEVAVAESARVVHLRTGVVLGKDGRAWQKMAPIFRLGLGGKFGDGQQFMPWIHLEDEIGGILHALDQELSGPLNLVGEESVRNVEFTRTLADVLRRPAVLPAPAFALKLALGEFAKEGLLASMRVQPAALSLSAYQFRFPTLRSALADLV